MITLRSTATPVLRIFQRVLIATGLLPGLLWDVEIELWRRDIEGIVGPVDEDLDAAWVLPPIPGVH